VIWLTALELAQEDDVVLISSNSQDFADPDDATKLHPDLVGDLDTAGLATDRVRLIPAPYEFVEDRGPLVPLWSRVAPDERVGLPSGKRQPRYGAPCVRSPVRLDFRDGSSPRACRRV